MTASQLPSAVAKLHRCVVKIKMKAQFEDGGCPRAPEVRGQKLGMGPLAAHFIPTFVCCDSSDHLSLADNDTFYIHD